MGCESKEKQGIVHYELVEERVNAQIFHNFLANAKVHSAEERYLLLDNASIHRAPKRRKELGLPTIEEQLNPKNSIPTYLPTHSPQFNPIELLFNTIRHNIEKSRAWTPKQLKETVDREMERLNKEDLRKYFKKCMEENLLNILRKFYVCREPKPNKSKLWVDKKNNLFIEMDSRLVRKIKNRQKLVKKLRAGERKEVQARHIETNLDFTRTKENDSLERIRLEVEGEVGDCFFNSHHRRKYSEKLTNLKKGEEVNLVLLGGESLVFVDRVIC